MPGAESLKDSCRSEFIREEAGADSDCFIDCTDALPDKSGPTGSSGINPVPRDRADIEIVGADSFARRPVQVQAPIIPPTAPTPSRINPVLQDLPG